MSDTVAIIEGAKLALQLAFMLMRNANLTTDQEIEMLMKEREKFRQLKPLPEV